MSTHSVESQKKMIQQFYFMNKVQTFINPWSAQKAEDKINAWKITNRNELIQALQVNQGIPVAALRRIIHSYRETVQES